LSAARVAVFGLGGVGGHVVESLARSGIGALGVIDNDIFTESNLNRQIFANLFTLGMKKTDAAKERILSINPDCKVLTFDMFYLPETEGQINFSDFDYIVDAIDTVTAKIAIITRAKNEGIPVISCMGTGNKLNPSLLEVTDIYKTDTCPLARIIRYELRQRGVKDLKVVYSRETPIKAADTNRNATNGVNASGNSGGAGISESMGGTSSSGDANSLRLPYKKPIPGSTAFVPGAAGLLIASEVVRDILGI
ncbi:MAG: tRNA threonylcarbamoyladenosine dehydratase, partial [Ruminococcus sp.]|nr:tRNA threonylcarbamoyladenosine dehydratase [Ruminococcus sp.]